MSPAILVANRNRSGRTDGEAGERIGIVCRRAFDTPDRGRAWRLIVWRFECWVVAVLCAGVSVTAQAGADDAASQDGALRTARLLAASCTSCHGFDGQATDGMPSLAGYPQARMVETMQAFRTGQRPATVMHQLARGFSDEQLAMLADHFARLPVTR